MAYENKGLGMITAQQLLEIKTELDEIAAAMIKKTSNGSLVYTTAYNAQTRTCVLHGRKLLAEIQRLQNQIKIAEDIFTQHAISQLYPNILRDWEKAKVGQDVAKI